MAREPSSRDDIRFIENFKRLRTEKGMRQADVAETMREWGWDYFTQSTVSRLEKDERPLKLGEARALASIIGKPLTDLIAPAGDIAAMDHLSAGDRQGRKALTDLYEATMAILNARSYLNFAVKGAQKVDPAALGDDNLELRFRAELQSAEATLRSLEEAISELSEDTLRMFMRDPSDDEEEPDGFDQ